MKKFIPSKEHSFFEPKRKFIERIKIESKISQIVKVLFWGKTYQVDFGVESPIVTPFGNFQMIPARVTLGHWGRHYFMFYPNLKTLLKRKKTFLRIDSGCFCGMVLGDITCDCLEQLRISQKACVANRGGIVIEIPGQDGRGWGEDFKMANQRIMNDLRMTTAETARIFYGSDEQTDIRTYDECAIILRAFGFGEKHCFEMATNNPKKIEGIRKMGLKIADVKSVLVENPNSILKRNLESKEKCWGHKFNNNKLKK
jgi:GTP cyclohydrolase II